MNKGNAMVLTFLRRACAVASCTLFATQIEAAEKLISTNLDTRTVLAFRVPNEAVRKLLPAGWELDAAPDGTNLRIVFANNLLVQDAEEENSSIVSLEASTGQLRKLLLQLSSASQDKIHRLLRRKETLEFVPNHESQ